eukprot:GHVT01049352.1.p2 GENE.GHVT01049352.1~~GHVT01049352.1.p2  ORF type:complete len:120 (+),score=10.96 GHVT01049352.1:39-362(+)
MGPSNSQRLPAARQSAPGVDATTLRELWTMLDDMAENHPEEYDKMIMDQRNELMQGIAQKQMDRRNEMVAEMGSFVEEEEFRPVITCTKRPYFSVNDPRPLTRPIYN